jgi:hypothetical protein
LQKLRIDRFENLPLKIDRFGRTSRTCAKDATEYCTKFYYKWIFLHIFRREQGHNGQTVLIPETFEAQIYSRNYTLSQLQELLDEWVDDYEKFGKKTNKIILKWRVNGKKDSEANLTDKMNSFKDDKKLSKTVGMEGMSDTTLRFQAVLHQVMI